RTQLTRIRLRRTQPTRPGQDGAAAGDDPPEPLVRGVYLAAEARLGRDIQQRHSYYGRAHSPRTVRERLRAPGVPRGKAGGMKSPEANGLQSSTVQTPSRSAQADKVAAAGSATGEKWAVCCSGGGIRSAAYCLGAIQSLQQGGLLRKARWILGVSGGSYI